MRQDSITKLLNKKVITFFAEGKDTTTVQSLIYDKIRYFAQIIRDEGENDLYGLLIADVDYITPESLKNRIMYIHECEKMIEKIRWIAENKHKFPQFSNIKMFNLLALKEALSKENALPF